MNRHLLTLEHGAASEVREAVIANLFREAHSLKGAAGVVRLTEVEGLSHELENLFVGMRERGGEPVPGALQRAYQALDSIGVALGRGAGTGTAAVTDGETPAARDRDDPADAPVPRRPASEDTVRVATGKVDALMAQVGELLVSRISAERRVTDARDLEAALDDWDSTWRELRRHIQRPPEAEGAAALLEETGARLHAAQRDLRELRRLLEADARRTAQITTGLQDDVRRMRMRPVSTVLEPFPRMVRDLARDSGKDVALSISGGHTEVDRSVLEQIKDPLTHLLRNSVDHGIEAPEVRAEAGKRTTGTVSLSAQHSGDRLVIEVADDGTGIDVERVRHHAVKNGMVTSAAAAELSDRQAVSLIFRSGLSTSPVITELSGRGVGLDVVREAVELLHGSVDVESRLGAGTTFALSLPLSISTMHCLLIEAGGQTFALEASAVERVMRVGPEETGRAGGRETVRVDGRPVLLTRLSHVLGLDTARDGHDHGGRRPVVVLGRRGRCAAFLVDGLPQTCDAVVKTLPDPLFRVRHVDGATILGSGRVAMILSPADLMASVERAGGTALAVVAAPDAPPATVLVVEDSITTRTLEKHVLEAAGYRVRVAGDGAEGWSSLQSGACDLVVVDIEMPVMDGFELTARIRADRRYQDLPIVLVTSRGAPSDRERGIHAGADAYLVKGAFDQDRLLDTIRRLI
jgi:two-component system, chemotaxis family, sensor kinase CheA